MRASQLLLLLASSLPFAACGGGTPPPKDENEAAKASSTPDSENKSSSASPSSPSTPEPKSSSGDLVAPTSDDPWMAPHQMPASDVLHTMRAATGRVNACWHAARKRDSSVGGEVKIKFVISHEGAVRVWRNEDSTCGDEEAINCVGEVIKSLKFPVQKSPGDAWGIFAINFGG